jgi:hypothetical protein
LFSVIKISRKKGLSKIMVQNIPEKKFWMHPLCKKLSLNLRGPYVELNDGSLLVADDNTTRISTDDGETWSDPRPICECSDEGIPGRGVMIKTKNNVLVMVYLDEATSKSKWDYKAIKASIDSRMNVWVIRSFDWGKTWTDRHKIFDGSCAYIINIIQTRNGEIVVPIQDLAPERTRHVQHTLVSTDDGRTWRQSNMIDLGGHGDHDGAFESTLAELSDGSLVLLIRTSLDQFWKAYSTDGGRYWRVLEPSGIDASNSPGHLVRLVSGRLVLVWNRLYRQGETSIRRTDEYWSFVSEYGCSWMRNQLSIAFSNDDGKTWTTPIVIVQDPNTVAYPYVFERRPGEIWITTGPSKQSSISLSLKEDDFTIGK